MLVVDREGQGADLRRRAEAADRRSKRLERLIDRLLTTIDELEERHVPL